MCLCNFASMSCILDDTLARALIKDGKMTDSTKVVKNTLLKRDAAVRLIVLNPSKFESIANKYALKNEFLSPKMMIEIKHILVLQYEKLNALGCADTLHNEDTDYVQVPSLKRWIEKARDGSFWPTKRNWIDAAKKAYTDTFSDESSR